MRTADYITRTKILSHGSKGGLEESMNKFLSTPDETGSQIALISITPMPGFGWTVILVYQARIYTDGK